MEIEVTSGVIATLLKEAARAAPEECCGLLLGRGGLVSEARAADAYLQERGVPATALRLEVDGRTSYESLAASARFLTREGIEEVILVSDGWHLGRSAEIARDVGLVPRTSPAPGSVYTASTAVKQMVRETAGLAIGRLIGFRRLDNLATTLASG